VLQAEQATLELSNIQTGAKKLACSKETDGCARCKREGIKCIYSPQKPMGRPKKRPHSEVEAVPAPIAPPQPEHAEIIPPFDPALTMELDLSFLDFENQDMNFFDLIDSNFTTNTGAVALQVDGAPPAAKKPNTDSGSHTWMGDFMGTINFDGVDKPPPEPEYYTEVSREDIQAILAAELPDKLPGLSPAPSNDLSSETTPSNSGEADTPLLPPTCACLSTLYLALDSLQRLPNDVVPAMKVARTAARAAHDAVLCDTCGNPPLEQSFVPPIASFQSLMMLGALIPSLANAYTRILAMVDAEAVKADKEHRKLNISLDDYGGLWGSVAMGWENTLATDKLTANSLDPALWRLTVRSLLRIDVYGLHAAEPGKATAQFSCCHMLKDHPGLKDIINMVEERSRKRHQQVDMALAAGLIQKPDDHECTYKIGDEPPCMKIINLAKSSLNRLVIP